MSVRDRIELVIAAVITLVVAIAVVNLVGQMDRQTVSITPAQSRAIVQGQSAVSQANQSLQLSIQSAQTPVPDYGSAPGCTPSGCVAVLTP